MIISLTETEYKALKNGMENNPYESNGIVTRYTGLVEGVRSIITVDAEKKLCTFYFGDYDSKLPKG